MRSGLLSQFLVRRGVGEIVGEGIDDEVRLQGLLGTRRLFMSDMPRSSNWKWNSINCGCPELIATHSAILWLHCSRACMQLIYLVKSKTRLTHTWLKVHLGIFVWIYDTFENNFGSENGFTTYLKESSWKCFESKFSFKYLSNSTFAARLYQESWDVSINGFDFFYTAYWLLFL